MFWGRRREAGQEVRRRAAGMEPGRRADRAGPVLEPWGSFQALSWPGVAEDYYAHLQTRK